MLDTDTLSEIGKGVNPTIAGNATAYRQTFGRYTTSVVTVMEIVRGFQRRASTQRLQSFVASLAVLEILPFDQPSSELAGRIAGDLERLGRPIGVADPMIAAIAITPGTGTGHRQFHALSFSGSSSLIIHSRWSTGVHDLRKSALEPASTGLRPAKFTPLPCPAWK